MSKDMIRIHLSNGLTAADFKNTEMGYAMKAYNQYEKISESLTFEHLVELGIGLEKREKDENLIKRIEAFTDMVDTLIFVRSIIADNDSTKELISKLDQVLKKVALN